jgi:X-Pro dipeptidyl-peptidase (S15 family)
MVNRISGVDPFGVRKLAVLAVVILGLAAPSTASASITSVFGTVTCTTQGSGQRWCGNTAGTTVPSWDGTPIDVSVAFPPATGADDNYPVVGIYHGYGGSKILPSSASAQRWLAQGYAVFSITDRGFGGSCGTKSAVFGTPACEHGYIHLMSRAFEVRDAQYLLGLLADEGVINPQEIGANGGSYGGGMSLQLGSLKDRVQLPDGELIPWVSPKGTPMKIEATAPEVPWTDLSQSLQPNGSNLDYVAEAPYSGVLGNHEFGIQKQNWNEVLYFGGLFAGGFYAPPPAEPEANITEWFAFNSTGGPYNGLPLAVQQETQLPNHGAYYTNLSEPPAPALMENGWNDDLFPVDQTVDYYNKVRARYPTAAVKLFDLDLGHNPRSSTAPSAIDVGKLIATQNAWFAYFIRGEGSEPSGARGGVTAITSVCPLGTSGQEYSAQNWASLAPGEIRLEGAAEQTIQAPGIAPKTPFTASGTTVCTTEAAGENASAATYQLAPAAAEGFTIAGSSTVIGEFSTPAANDQIIARLYDVNEPEGGTQRLIGRAVYRPINPGGGFTKQVFQLHPQAWKIAAGHVVMLELLMQDSTYARNSSTPQSIPVKNLELRLPTIEPPGSDGGLVEAPAPKYLPAGYSLALGDYTQVITGTFTGPLVVKAGQVVELASTGQIIGPVRVESGGAFDIEGGTVTGPVTATKAARLRFCGATISGPVRASGGTGPIVIGGPGCPGNTIVGPVTATGNTAGVLIEGNVIKGPLTVTGNSGGTTVNDNSVSGPTNVKGNS